MISFSTYSPVTKQCHAFDVCQNIISFQSTKFFHPDVPIDFSIISMAARPELEASIWEFSCHKSLTVLHYKSLSLHVFMFSPRVGVTPCV